MCLSADDYSAVYIYIYIGTLGKVFCVWHSLCLCWAFSCLWSPTSLPSPLCLASRTSIHSEIIHRNNDNHIVSHSFFFCEISGTLRTPCTTSCPPTSWSNVRQRSGEASRVPGWRWRVGSRTDSAAAKSNGMCYGLGYQAFFSLSFSQSIHFILYHEHWLLYFTY